MSSIKKMTYYEKMAESPIPSLILRLSVPTVISMLVTNIYNMVDTAFVGLLGTSASGAVGVVFGFMAIIQAFGFMFGQGSGSILSRSLGSKDIENASKTATTGFTCSFLFGIIFIIIGLPFLDQLVVLLGSTDTIAVYAKDYIIFILFASPFMASSLTLNNILRYEGKAALGMVGLMTGAVLNMALDPILMFGLNMGIAGAGLSTALSQLVSFSILISMFIRGKTIVKLKKENFVADVHFILNIMTTGFPSLLRQGLNSVATVLLNTQASVYGDGAVAAMSIVSRIVFFVMSVAIGIGQGFQPVSGFNYGAKKYSRLRKAYVFTFIMAELLVIIGLSIVLVNADGLIGIFRNDPEVIEIGTRALKLQMLTLLFVPITVVTEMLFQTTGNKLRASVLSALRSGIFFIPTLIILAKIRGLAGIQEAQPVAYVLTFVPALVMAIIFFIRLPKLDGDIEDA